jgi:hypothetical protein
LFAMPRDRLPRKRARSGAPASARSPTTSSVLAHEFVRTAVRPVQHHRPIHDHRIGEAAALGQAGGAQAATSSAR